MLSKVNVTDNNKRKIDKRRRLELLELLDVIVNSRVLSIKDDDQHICCAICLLNINIGESYSNLRCCHMFHTECIKSWFAIKTNCPLCRERVYMN